MTTDLIVSYKGEEQVLPIDDCYVITFRNGLVGFPEWRRFVLLEDPEEGPLGVLHCIDDPKVSLLVTDPWHVCADYLLELPPEELKDIEVEKIEDARTLCILTIGDGPVVATANLLGPVVVNPRTRIASQVVLQHSQYSAQHPVLTLESRLATGNDQKTSLSSIL